MACPSVNHCPFRQLIKYKIQSIELFTSMLTIVIGHRMTFQGRLGRLYRQSLSWTIYTTKRSNLSVGLHVVQCVITGIRFDPVEHLVEQLVPSFERLLSFVVSVMNKVGSLSSLLISTIFFNRGVMSTWRILYTCLPPLNFMFGSTNKPVVDFTKHESSTRIKLTLCSLLAWVDII